MPSSRIRSKSDRSSSLVSMDISSDCSSLAVMLDDASDGAVVGMSVVSACDDLGAIRLDRRRWREGFGLVEALRSSIVGDGID